jgi:hypothetical protein
MLQASLLPGVLMALKGQGGIRQELVPPLVILGLADLVLVTDFGDRLALRPSITIKAFVLVSHLRFCMADLLCVSHSILSSSPSWLSREHYMVEHVLRTDEASELTETVSPLELVLVKGGRFPVRNPQDSDRQVFRMCRDPNDKAPCPQVVVSVPREPNRSSTDGHGPAGCSRP